MTQQIIEPFHSHLNKCPQCREHPFDLCPIGSQLATEVRAALQAYALSLKAVGAP